MDKPVSPFWLEPSARTGGGMWPLGLETTGFAIADRLLPAINTTVRRPRYYAFFAWVHETHTRVGGPLGYTFDEWRARLEMALRLCTATRDPEYTGLVGRDSVAPVEAAPGASVRLVEDAEIISAYSPAFYSSSFAQFGCLGEEADGSTGLSGAVGRPLALAFDEDVRAGGAHDSALGWILSREPEVPAWVIHEMAEPLGLRGVGPNEAAHAPLVDLLLRLRAPDAAGNSPQHVARTRSVALLLDVLAQARWGLPRREPLHPVFATRRLPDGSELKVDPALEATLRAWERFQEREFEKMALYGFWSVLIAMLGNGSASAGALLERVRGEAGSSPLLVRWTGAEGLDATVAETQRRVLAVADADLHGAGGVMVAWVDILRDRGSTVGERAAAALLLLVLVTATWRERREALDRDLVRLHELGDSGRLSLEFMVGEMDRRGGDTLRELLRWVLGTAVIGQANRVALEKVARGTANVFLLRDEAGYRARSGLHPFAYLNYDDPAVENAYRLLAGLGLVQEGETWQITPLGEATLARARRGIHAWGDFPAP